MSNVFAAKALAGGEVESLSEYAKKLIEYSTNYHRERPAETKKICVEVGMGRLEREYGGRSHIVNSALVEIAAKSVFHD